MYNNSMDKTLIRYAELSEESESSNLLGFKGGQMVFVESTSDVVKSTKKGPKIINNPADDQKYLILQGKKFQILNMKDGETKVKRLPCSYPKSDKSIFIKINKSLLGEACTTGNNSESPSEPIIDVDNEGQDLLNSIDSAHLQTMKTQIANKLLMESQMHKKKMYDVNIFKKSVVESHTPARRVVTVYPQYEIESNLGKKSTQTIPRIDTKPKGGIKSVQTIPRKDTKVQVGIKSTPNIERRDASFQLVKPFVLKTYKKPIDLAKEPSNNNKTKLKFFTTISTNTDTIDRVDKGIQTDDLLEMSLDSFWNQFSTPEDADNIIIGKNVDMGSAPQAIQGADMGNIGKIQFFRDLNRCLTWESGNLPIHKAVLDNDLVAVKRQCILLKARNSNVNIVNVQNYTPLHLAIKHSAHIDIVKVLFEQGDMTIQDADGNTILHLAVETDRPDLMELFLKNEFIGELDINQFNHAGLSPLMCCAISTDREGMAKMLLDNGALKDLQDLKSGRTALFHAAENHNIPMVHLLLDYMANTRIRNFFGTSVHDAMFELDDMPYEIKYPILGRELKTPMKRKLMFEKSGTQKRLKMVPTFQKIMNNTRFIVHQNSGKDGQSSLGGLLLREMK